MPPRLVLVALLSLCVSSRAQEGSGARFSSAAELVVLHLTVTDSRGRYVDDLEQDAFAVLEDGRPQKISFFTSDDLPVTAGLLIDNSTSMHSIRDRVIAGAVAFAGASHPRDEIFALAFNEHVRPALPPGAPFTSDAAVLKNALTNAITARGLTGLFDAIVAGLEYAARGAYQRKVLVVISDGGDNASKATFDEVTARTQAANVVLYTVALTEPVDRQANPKALKGLAEATGGRAFAPRDTREVASALQRIAADIRRAYTIAYVPATPADGSFRRLRVIVSPPNRQRVVVRTRNGYLAGLAKSRSDDVVRAWSQSSGRAVR